MLRTARCLLLVLPLCGLLLVRPAWAENEGLADLNRATEAKLAAETLADLGEVIGLLESALDKGLDKDNTELANTLLAATRIQRGMLVAQTAVFGSMPPDPRWPQFRQFALRDLEEGVKIDKDQPQALFLIAKLNFLPGGDADRATGALDEAIRLADNEPGLKAQALLVRAGLAKEDDKKQADLDKAVEVAPNKVTALRARASFYADQEQFEKALADVDRALELADDDADILIDRAEVLIELKHFDKALADLEKARQLEPKSAAPLVQQARIHALQDDYPTALKELNEANDLDPANVMVLLLRAMVHQQLDDKDKAMADIDLALTLRPGLPQAMRFRAMLLAGEGKFDEAISELERLQRSMPGDEESQLQLGMFYAAENQPYKAIEILTKVLERDPDNLFALRSRADALLAVGKQAEAIADYEKALAQEPDDSHVLNNLSWVLSTSPDEKIRNGKRALELAQKACEVTEYKQAHILSTLAAAHAELGDFDKAVEWSTKAVETGSEDQIEALKKELESYKKGEPTRELQTAPPPEELPGLPGVEPGPKPEEPEKPDEEEPKPKKDEPVTEEV